MVGKWEAKTSFSTSLAGKITFSKVHGLFFNSSYWGNCKNWSPPVDKTCSKKLDAEAEPCHGAFYSFWPYWTKYTRVWKKASFTFIKWACWLIQNCILKTFFVLEIFETQIKPRNTSMKFNWFADGILKTKMNHFDLTSQAWLSSLIQSLPMFNANCVGIILTCSIFASLCSYRLR